MILLTFSDTGITLKVLKNRSHKGKTVYLLLSWKQSCKGRFHCHWVQVVGVVACWVGAVASELVWRGVAESGRKRAGESGIHHDSQCHEGWESWGGMAQSRREPGGVEEAAGVGGWEPGLSHLC